MISLSFSAFLPSVAFPKEAIAREGDGIYTLMRRNGLSTDKKQLDEFIRLNRDRLLQGNQLIKGKHYLLPSEKGGSQPAAKVSPSTKNYPIFGPAYAQVKRLDNSLSGCVLYLVSGHGGPDPGAMGKRDGHILTEDEYAYDITLRLARRLIESGAEAHMIVRDARDGIRNGQWLNPTKNEVCYPNQPIPLNQMARLRQRAAAVNALYRKNRKRRAYHRTVMIHVDSRSQGNRIDVFFYHHPQSRYGQRFAQALRDTFDEKYRQHQPGRGYQGTITSRNLYMLRMTDPPAVYVELGNINNRNDQIRFLMENNRQALANWLYDGIARDYQRSR